MLKIQVLGKGMIPRGYGLAPRKEFFKADLNLIQTILMTPGLTVNMLNPENDKIMPVTKANVKVMWDKYRSDVVRKATAPIKQDSPSVPPTTTATVNNKPSTENVEVKPGANFNTLVADPDKDENQGGNVVAVNNENTVVPTVKAKEPVEDKVEEKKDEAPAPIKPILNEDRNKNNNQNHNNQNKK